MFDCLWECRDRKTKIIAQTAAGSVPKYIFRFTATVHIATPYTFDSKFKHTPRHVTVNQTYNNNNNNNTKLYDHQKSRDCDVT